MLPLICVFLLVLIVQSRPYFWGLDSAPGRRATARVLAIAPVPQAGEWSTFARALVVRDRAAVAGSSAAVILLTIFWGEVPASWVILTPDASYMFLAITVIQPITAIILSIFGVSHSFGTTSRVSAPHVARLNRVGVLNYVSRATVLFPLGLLTASAAVNIALLLPGARATIAPERITTSLLCFAGCTLLSIAAFTVAAVVVRRGSISQTRFGVFATDLVRLEAVRSLFALSTSVAAISLQIAGFVAAAPLLTLGEDAASGFAVLWVCIVITVALVLFRMTLQPTSPELLQRLWGAKNEHATDA